jgi:acyl-coenzyme A thioesterase PaaI-like protein
MTPANLQAALSEFFAPWVQAMALEVVEATPQSIILRLPNTSALTRTGNMVCGQAMMAAADTAMALAVFNHFGQFTPCTTVQMSSSFLKPLIKDDGLLTATVVRAGKSLVFGEVDLRNAVDGKSVFRTSLTYALV